MSSDGPAGSGDEELRHGTDRLPPRLRRPASVVLVALAGLAVAWVSTRLAAGDGTTAGPSSSVSASPSRSATVPVPGLTGASASIVFVPSGPAAQPAATALPTPTCPSGVRCATTVALPAGVTAALRENYPGARVVSSRTITRTVAGETSLVGRSIAAVAGARRFEISVGPYVMGPDDFDRQNSATRSTVSVESATPPGQTVRLVLTEPRVARPNDLIVLRLARDPRLGSLR